MGYVFIKPHRVGSTTMRVIFERYAERHGLRVLRIANFPDLPRGIDRLVPDLAEHLDPPYDVSARHIAYDESWFRSVVRDPVFVSLVRDPLRRAVSQYHAFVRGSRDAERSFDEWYLENRDRQPPPVPDRPVEDPDTVDAYVETVRVGFNDYLTYWLGLEADEPVTREGLARRYITVGVTERYDESLAVMRHVLGWELQDIRYSGALSSGGCVGVTPRHVADATPVSKEVVAAFEANNRRDFELYRLANELLDEQIDAFSPSVLDDVRAIAAERRALDAGA